MEYNRSDSRSRKTRSICFSLCASFKLSHLAREHCKKRRHRIQSVLFHSEDILTCRVGRQDIIEKQPNNAESKIVIKKV